MAHGPLPARELDDQVRRRRIARMSPDAPDPLRPQLQRVATSIGPSSSVCLRRETWTSGMWMGSERIRAWLVIGGSRRGPVPVGWTGSVARTHSG